MLLGERVRELRKEHGWSQGELGDEDRHRRRAGSADTRAAGSPRRSRRSSAWPKSSR